MQPFGWLFFGVGMIFAFVFAGSADVSSIFKFHCELQQAVGVVTGSERSGFSEGRKSRGVHGSSLGRRRKPVFAHYYTFETGGENHSGVSYSKNGALEIGQTVKVEFPAHQPEFSRIQGMRRAPLGAEALLVLLFPLVGLCILIPGLCSGWKTYRLLIRGVLAKGRLIGKKKLDAQVDKRFVYKLTFQFTDQERRTHWVDTKTHHPRKLEDDATERLLYDPLSPKRAVFVDMLPGAPDISEDGRRVAGVRLKRVLIAIVPPLLALLVIAFGVILKSL